MHGTFTHPDWDGWEGTSSDPNDRQFGDITAALEPTETTDVPIVLVGEPYDGAVIGRKGTREGPLEIRRSLASTKAAHLSAGAPSLEGESNAPDESMAVIGDLGDLELPGSGVADVQASVRTAAAAIYELDAVPIFLGGDNSLTYGNVVPLLENEDGGDVGVINFDAHLDCREVHHEPTSGTPYRQLHEAGLEAYVAVGARHFETSSRYVEYVREQGGTIVPADAFADGPRAVVETVQNALATVDTLYLSVDCDVLDASAAPGVSAPTPGGLTTRELFAAVGALVADERLAGVEIVECAPPLDTNGRTVDAAARTVAHAIRGVLEANS
ncbi:formimidoylglutamase [Natronolimnobius sp. AArcel1]|uniref:formimidoylglutamase n=1 Tax=Natronolimnobius sp. AArcel1 TaxID=1679093 RepID=UPI0013EC1E32|nr:formimidoylglutamase [Natronolimnobius sp. AArcel1]